MLGKTTLLQVCSRLENVHVHNLFPQNDSRGWRRLIYRGKIRRCWDWVCCMELCCNFKDEPLWGLRGRASHRTKTPSMWSEEGPSVDFAVRFPTSSPIIPLISGRTASLHRTASAGRQTNRQYNQGSPQVFLPIRPVFCHPHSVLSVPNVTWSNYDNLQTCSFTPRIASPLWFYKSFFVVYKLLYLTINWNKWGNNSALYSCFARVVTSYGCYVHFCLQMAMKRASLQKIVKRKWKAQGINSRINYITMMPSSG